MPFQWLRRSPLKSIAEEVRCFGQDVRLRRIALGLRQADLAPRARVSVRHLRAIETGHGGVHPTLGIAISIARGLGTDLQDLLGGFKGLTPLGIEAGRICDALPARFQSAALELLRALAREAGFTSPSGE